MSAAGGGLSLGLMRGALRRAIERGSAVSVAREVGITPPALRSIAYDAVKPRAATLRKLEQWLMNRSDRAELTEDYARFVFAAFMDSLPAKVRRHARAAVSQALRQSYERAKIPPPEWLK